MSRKLADPAAVDRYQRACDKHSYRIAKPELSMSPAAGQASCCLIKNVEVIIQRALYESFLLQGSQHPDRTSRFHAGDDGVHFFADMSRHISQHFDANQSTFRFLHAAR